MPIARGIYWILGMLNHVVSVFLFILTYLYTLLDFSRSFLGGSLSPPSSEPPVDAFLISIPLVLYFVLDGVIFWEVVGELGFFL
jgi:hypothetical protein